MSLLLCERCMYSRTGNVKLTRDLEFGSLNGKSCPPPPPPPPKVAPVHDRPAGCRSRLKFCKVISMPAVQRNGLDQSCTNQKKKKEKKKKGINKPRTRRQAQCLIGGKESATKPGVSIRVLVRNFESPPMLN